jgi:hypothetical protein
VLPCFTPWKVSNIEFTGYKTTYPVQLIWCDALEVVKQLFGDLVFVTRTSVVGLAPIHFLPRSRLLPIPGGLRTHTHAIPILADRTLSLSLLVIFPLITSSFACTISARRILSSFPLCPFHSTGTHPIIL